MIKDIQEEIIRLKKERGAVILAHCYQTHDILEVADYVGDSFGLAQNARKTDAQTVIMCGVRFMAETVKILCPEKTGPQASSGRERSCHCPSRPRSGRLLSLLSLSGRSQKQMKSSPSGGAAGWISLS